jgi:urea transport system substrate-binding protein
VQLPEEASALQVSPLDQDIVSNTGYDPDAINIALVIPLHGSAGLFGPSCELCALLACEEVNAGAGVLSRQLSLRVVDGASSPEVVAGELDLLITAGVVDAVVGWHISAVRVAVAPRIAGRVPYVYTALYEGGERTPGVFLTGEVPSRQLLPPMRWLARERKAKRWYILGNDYVWPRASAAVVRRHAKEYSIDIAGSAFVGLGAEQFEMQLRQVEEIRPDAVLMLLVGQDAVQFNRAFAARGLPDVCQRFSPLMEENMLLATGADAAAGICSAAGYFETLVTAESLEFEARYVRRFGPQAPTLNSLGESCYEGIKLLTSLIRHAGSLDTLAMAAVADSTSYEGARGALSLHNRHVDQRVYLADARGLDFDVVTEV